MDVSDLTATRDISSSLPVPVVLPQPRGLLAGFLSRRPIILPLTIAICFMCLPQFIHGQSEAALRDETADSKEVGLFTQSHELANYTSEEQSMEREGRSLRIWRRRDGHFKSYPSRYKTASHRDGMRLRRPSFQDLKPIYKRRRPGSQPKRHVENDIFYRRTKRPHKYRYNGLQKPTPPSELHDYFDNADYFPEETKRNTGKHTGSRRPSKKRRNPIHRKKKTKKPLLYSKPSTEDDDSQYIADEDRKVVYHDETSHKKSKKEPSVSYSTFIQHPSDNSGDNDYEYSEEEDSRPVKPQKKKRRVNKINNNKSEDDTEEYRIEIGSPTFQSDDYDTRPKTNVVYKQEPVYGEGHISHHNSGSPPVYTPSNVFRNPVQDDYTHQRQNFQTFNTVQYQQSHPVQVQSNTNASPVYKNVYEPHSNTYSGYQEPSQTPYNVVSQTNGMKYTSITQPSVDYNIQKTNSYSSGSSSSYAPSRGGNSYDNIITSSSNGVYSSYRDGSDQQSSVFYSSQPEPSIYQKEVRYRTNPSYNVDSYSDYDNGSNGNAYRKYSTYSSRYSDRGGAIVQSYSSHEDDSDFLQRHQNLYNNGFNGVPVQGNGYSRHDIKKEYDIGYGEFQFDENPA